MKKSLLTIIILFICTVLLCSASVLAEEVTLVWDPNSEADLAGYNVYYVTDGKALDQGRSPVKIDLSAIEDPQRPTMTLTGIQKNTRYFFSITAFNQNNIESDFSNYIGYIVPPDVPAIPATPKNIKVSGISYWTINTQ